MSTFVRAHPRLWVGAIAVLVTAPMLWQGAEATSRAGAVPPAPARERVVVKQVDLGGTVAADGTCPDKTGCISGGQVGDFLSDSRTFALVASYAGAPTGSPFSGAQVTLAKGDGSTFGNGETVKCLTCGTPAANKRGMTADLSYPQTFPDDKRILAGTNIVDCRPYLLASADCTPDNVHVYPIRWANAADGSGPGGSMREVRLAPDGVHVAWSHILLGPLGGVDPANPGKTTRLDELAYYGRLVFHAAPTTGTPVAPRYDVERVNLLLSPTGAFNDTFVRVDPHDPAKLQNHRAGSVGELRGFTGNGRRVVGMCYASSNNTDICATELFTKGALSERRTADPSYIDPVDVSPDDKRTVALEARQHGRFNYIAGLPGVPPINQVLLASGGAAASGYRNGEHRFFQPYLLDRFPERDGYEGQQLNACTGRDTERTPNSICDPNWGTQADPRWSPNGTRVVFGQNNAVAPDCEGTTGVVECSAKQGRQYRALVAQLVQRKPLRPLTVPTLPDLVPWATPYKPGDADPVRPHVPSGTYTLSGKHSGSATVVVVESPDKAEVIAVSAVYDAFSDDGKNVLSGTESVTNAGGAAGPVTFHSALQLSGAHTGSRVTSPGGFTITVVNAFTGEMAYAGLMTTVLDGQAYLPPLPTR
ncbi:MAG: hypothetical protein ABR549_03880 [Mycobacteriales bacterium]